MRVVSLRAVEGAAKSPTRESLTGRSEDHVVVAVVVVVLVVVVLVLVVRVRAVSTDVIVDVGCGQNLLRLLLLVPRAVNDPCGFERELVDDDRRIVRPPGHEGVTKESPLVLGLGAPVPHEI